MARDAVFWHLKLPLRLHDDAWHCTSAIVLLSSEVRACFAGHLCSVPVPV